MPGSQISAAVSVPMILLKAEFASRGTAKYFSSGVLLRSPFAQVSRIAARIENYFENRWTLGLSGDDAFGARGVAGLRTIGELEHANRAVEIRIGPFTEREGQAAAERIGQALE